MKRLRTTSRLFEQIFGVVGSFLAIISGSFIIFIQSFGTEGNSFIAILAIIGAILGFISSYYVNKDLEYAGVGFIASAVLILLGTPGWGVLGSLLIMLAGISALFRK